MAAPTTVRDYLAAWFQLGKTVVTDSINGAQSLHPQTVLNPKGFTPDFETCWTYIYDHADLCYLEGTDQTIADLLSERWDLEACYRCGILAPVPARGSCRDSGPCPCAGLDHWPSDNTLPPRPPEERFATLSGLQRIQSRLTHS